MTNKISTLRPGLLVGLKTSVTGNVKYDRVDLSNVINADGSHVSVHETTKTVEDAAEQEAAVKVRSRVRSLIRSACAVSPVFGFLCPEERIEKLDEAIAEARTIVDQFNSTANVTRVEFNVLRGRVAPTDVEAVRSINSEVSGILTDMQRGIVTGDPSYIRETALKAKQLAQMLAADAQAVVDEAVEVGRRVATAIAKSTKAGEEVVIDQAAVNTIAAKARGFTIDFDDGDVIVEAPVARKRTKLDLEDANNGL